MSEPLTAAEVKQALEEASRPFANQMCAETVRRFAATLDALTARLAASEAREVVLRDMLRERGRHHPECWNDSPDLALGRAGEILAVAPHPSTCSCGLESALAEQPSNAALSAVALRVAEEAVGEAEKVFDSRRPRYLTKAEVAAIVARVLAEGK